MKIKSILLAVFFCFALGTFSFAQTEEKFDFYTRGDHHTTYAQMEAYINAVQKGAPERVRIFDIGLTNEYRMQHIVAISSPQNIARLDDIKAANARLTDPRATNAAEAAQMA